MAGEYRVMVDLGLEKMQVFSMAMISVYNSVTEYISQNLTGEFKRQ